MFDPFDFASQTALSVWADPTDHRDACETVLDLVRAGEVDLAIRVAELSAVHLCRCIGCLKLRAAAHRLRCSQLDTAECELIGHQLVGEGVCVRCEGDYS